MKIWTAAADEAPRLLRTLEAPKPVLALAFLPGGGSVIVGLKSGAVLEVECASGAAKAAGEHAGSVLACAASTSATDATCTRGLRR